MRTSFHSLYNTNKLFVKALIALGMFLFLSVGWGHAAGTDDFVITVNANDSSFEIPTYFQSTYNYNVDCGDGSGLVTGITGDYVCTYGSSGTYTIRISGDYPHFYKTSYGDALKILSVDQRGTQVRDSMLRSFEGASNMNVLASDTPDLSNVTEMGSMFHNATSFNADISGWDVSGVNGMVRLFRGATSFNQDISSRDVSSVDDMDGMFLGATSFNQDISGWQVGNVADMDFMFDGATSFNQNLGGRDITNITTFFGMLDDSGLSQENYDNTLIGWNTQSLPSGLNLGSQGLEYCNGTSARANMIANDGRTISGDSQNCGGDPLDDFVITVNANDGSFEIPTIASGYSYNVDCEDDGTVDATVLTDDYTCTYSTAGTYTIRISGLFPKIFFQNSSDNVKILSVDQWGTQAWTWLRSGFEGCTNMDILATDTPDLSAVTSLEDMFKDADSMNSNNLSSWDVSTITDFTAMFRGADSFNQDLSSWSSATPTDINSMFFGATSFNGSVAGWDVSNVSNMTQVFRNTAFNQDLSSWDVSSATDFYSMFKNNTVFNQDLSAWNNQLGSAIDLDEMFYGASSFNGDITGWNVSTVDNFSYMFRDATAFNQDISGWNTSSATKMQYMFIDALAFDQNLGSWDMTGLTNVTQMLSNSNLSISNYDSTLIGWDGQNLPSGLNLGATGLEYCAGASARANMISSDGWSISGDSQSCTAFSCTDPAVTIPQIECEALVDIYNSTNGDSWTNGSTASGTSDAWLTIGSDPCSWTGVTCDAGIGPDTMNVQEVKLGFNNLVGPIPTSINDLLYLEALWLGGNDLTGGIPSEIYTMISLLDLRIHNTTIGGTISSSIGNLVNLTYLNLLNSELTGTLPTTIENLDSATDVLLGNQDLNNNLNSFTGGIPSEYGNLDSVEYLSIENCGVSGTIPSSLGNASTLQTLRISGNNLSGTIPVELGNLSNLNSLLIGGNNLTGRVPPELANSPLQFGFFIGDNSLVGALPNTVKNNIDPNNAGVMGSNQICGVSEPSWMYDGPYYDGPQYPSSVLCDDGVFCNDNTDCGSNNCGDDPADGLSYDVCLPVDPCGNGTQDAGEQCDTGGSSTNNCDMVTNACTCENGFEDDPNSNGCIASVYDCTTGFNNGDFLISISECEALVEFYDEMGGAGWDEGFTGDPSVPNGDTAWKTIGSDPCTWYGVGCNTFLDEVTSLTLTYNDVIGNMGGLNDFDDLIHLMDFDLSNSGPGGAFGFNDLNGTFPFEIEFMTELRNINVKDSNMSEFDLSFVESLINLQTFDISDNFMGGTIPDLSLLSDLISFDAGNYLSFTNNQLTGNIPDLSGLAFLTSFKIRDNNLTVSRFPESLGNLQNLTTEIDISGNNFEGAIPDSYNGINEFGNGLLLNRNHNNTANGYNNYVCGSSATIPANWNDQPYDSINSSDLCINGVFCNENADCQSNNCIMNSTLGYTTCQATTGTEYTCDASTGGWTTSGTSCGTINYDPSATYTPSSGVVCSDVLPANTSCAVCPDGEVDNGEQCDGSGQAQCNVGETCNATCGCEVSGPTGNEYSCQLDGTWTAAGASCSPLDYDGSGATTYDQNSEVVCADVTPDNALCVPVQTFNTYTCQSTGNWVQTGTGCSPVTYNSSITYTSASTPVCSDEVPNPTTCDADPVCVYCSDSTQCGLGESCSSGIGGTFFCSEDGLSCPTFGSSCGTSGVCAGACYPTAGTPPTTCEQGAECGEVSTTYVYDSVGDGSILTATSPGLCEYGTVDNFAFTGSGWRWDCINATGVDKCEATQTICGDNIVQTSDGEQCDGFGNPQCGIGLVCNATCGCEAGPVDGVCGSDTIMADFYRPDEPANYTLCENGAIATEYVYTANTGWAWTCPGMNGGNPVGCGSAETYCGDNTTQTGNGEQCDDGGTGTGDGCDDLCMNESLPTCTLTVDAQVKDAGSNWTLSVTKPDWVSQVRFDFDDGTAEQTYTTPGGSTSYERINSYGTIGEYNPIATLVHPYDGSEVSCTVLVQADESGALCGSDANSNFYLPNEPASGNACDQGTLNGTIQYDGTLHQWTWTCTSQFASHNQACIATEEYCGDGSLNGSEVCEGNDLNAQTCETEGFGGGVLSCSSSCTLDTSACESAVNGQCASVPGTLTASEFNALTNSEKCLAGTYLSGNPNPNGGNWTWSCEGAFGGTPSGTCTVPVTQANIACGTATNASYYANELNDINDPTLCDNGSPAPDLALANGMFTWTCGGNMCEANEKVDAVCGTSVPNPSSTMPLTDLCDAGTANVVNQTSTEFQWTCNGLFGGTNTAAGACTVSRTPTCHDNTGTAYAAAADITDTLGCDVGTITNGVTDLGSSFEWTCTNGTFESSICVADKDIEMLSCTALNYDLQLTDLGYNRFAPYLEESFTSVWTIPTQDGVSITAATFDGSSIGFANETHTASIDTIGTVNYVFTLENQYSSETLDCTFPVTVEGYQHTKDVHAFAIDTTNDQYVVTYRIESAMPESYDIATISDRINTGQGEGFVDILTNTVRILDAQGNNVSTNFAIIDSSLIAHYSEVDGITYTDGFDLAVQTTVQGAYGDFILEYEAVVLQDIDSDICNVCEINGDNGGSGAGNTSFIESVFAQSTYQQSDGVCIVPDPINPTDPSCQACDFNAGYVPCPGSSPDPAGTPNQGTTDVANIAQCGAAQFCGCYQYTPPVDACAGSCAEGFAECAGPVAGGGPNQARSYLAQGCADVPNPAACSCGPTLNCSAATLLPNTVACAPENPTQQNQPYVFDDTAGDYNTCAGAQECGMVCEPGASFDATANGGTGGCVPALCDESTKVDASTLPAGATIVDCAMSPSQPNQPYTFAADQDACDIATEGCMYFIECEFGQEWIGDETTGSCERSLDIEKTGLDIDGSRGVFEIEASVGPLTSPYTIQITDTLTTNPNNDVYSLVEIVELNGISIGTGGGCTITAGGTRFICVGFELDDEAVGGTIRINAILDPLVQGGDDEICDEITITTNDPSGNQEEIADACISGYNISVEKNVIPDYDSGKGNPAINTYPPNIAQGDIYHGDWVVYEVVATNDGPQDAFSPIITDTLPAGLEIIDYLTGSTTSNTATIDVVDWSVGAQLLELRMSGLYGTGDTTTLSFSARFDQNAAGSVTEICNDVEARGENQATELSPDDNITDECLNVPECGERQCTGEIFGTDFVRQEVITDATNGYGTVTIDGRCEIEGTCEMSDRIPTTQLSLTYQQCSGTYTTIQNSITNLWETTVLSDGKLTTVTFGTTPPNEGEIQATIEGFLTSSAFKEGEFELADETSLSPITSIGGAFTFDCRLGNPILACVKNTCDSTQSLSQAWVVGGPEWTDIADVLPPVEGSQSDSGTGFVQNFTCDTCDGGDGGDDDGEYCPEGQFPISDANGIVSCDTCIACGCCENGADLTVEYEETTINGQAGYNVIDVFCPEPPESGPPYPGRSYDFYDGTDLDGDGKPDVCVQYDKAITSVDGNTINYEITGFLGGVDGSQITITDTLDLGGVYNNDFVLNAAQGAGTVDSTITNNTAVLTVTKTGDASLSFSVTYSVTAAWAGTTPICNAVEFDDGDGTPTTDTECACQEGFEYCPLTNMCIPEGSGCGYDKTIVAINGDVISYQIAGWIPEGQTVVGLVDTLDGSTYNDDFLLQEVQGNGTMTSVINGDSVTFTVNKTSAQDAIFSFTITYTTTAGWSTQGSGDPIPACNDVFFTNGSTTIATDSECACPDGWYYCPFTGTCVPDGSPCGYDKVITEVTGNVISYQISGIVPADVSQIIIADTIDAATYNSDFVFASTDGTGLMATDIQGNSVTITVTKSSALDQLMNFTITYSVTAARSYETDGTPIPICNDIVASDQGSTIGTDSECACPEGRAYCPITDSCIPEGTPCGYDKRVTEVDGNIVSYEIEGVIGEGNPFIILTDTIRNATFNDDFTYVAVEGNGDFVSVITGLQADLRVTRIGGSTETVRFIIRYTTTANWSANVSSQPFAEPVCNDITLIPSANPFDPVDSECACPMGFVYCPINDLCLPEGEPCGYDKRVVNVTGDIISYEIDVLFPEGQQSLTITDTLSGASYNQTSVSLFTNPLNSAILGTVFNGNTAEFTLNKTSGVMQQVVGYIDYTATAVWTYEADGTTPIPVCNDVVFENNGTFIEMDGECACAEGYEYCPVTDSCIPEGTQCGDQSMCTGLTVVPNLSPSAPLIPIYECTGVGTTTSFEVTDSTGQSVYSSTDTSGTFTLPELGVHEAVCSYDGDTGLQCGNGPFSSAQLTLISNDVRNTVIALGGSYADISWTGWRSSLNDQTYLNTSRSGVVALLQNDLNTYVLDQMLLLPPTSGGQSPGLSVDEIVLNGIVENVVLSRCTIELCAVPIDVGGGGQVCDGLLTTDDLSVRAGNHSVDFNCIAEFAVAGQAAEIDCGNAFGTGSSTVYTGTTIDLGNGIFGMQGTCDYTRGSGNTLYTPTCSIAGVTTAACTQDVMLTRGGGGGGNTIVCGNGRIDPGEQCDDGNNTSGDSCSSSCTTEGSGSGGSGNGGSGRGSTGGSGGGGSNNPCGPNDVIFPGFCIENEPKCTEIDPPSIQVGEYLPFRWDLELGEAVDEGAYSCADIIGDDKRIPGNSLKCTFEIYNGSSDLPVTTIPDVPCMEDKWLEDNISLFNDFPFEEGNTPMGKSYVPIDERLTEGVYGEYQIVLSEVSYLACGEGDSGAVREIYSGVSNDRICSMNFAVSDSYMIHKGSSLKTGVETDLGAFKQLNGIRILPETIVEKIATSQLSSFDTEALVTKMRSFADKYTPLAVLDSRELLSWTGQLVKKVANDSVYVYDGGIARVPLTVSLGNKDLADTKTVIVKNADLIVEGSMYGNVLWIVMDGRVLFKNVDCDVRDVVQGFYVTQEGFQSIAIIDGELQNKIRNDNLGSYERCDDGRLVIDGFLLGPGLDTERFINSRRALLSQWFNIGYESQADKVFNGASLLFKTNTALWTLLPTGVNEFKDIIKAFR